MNPEALDWWAEGEGCPTGPWIICSGFLAQQHGTLLRELSPIVKDLKNRRFYLSDRGAAAGALPSRLLQQAAFPGNLTASDTPATDRHEAIDIVMTVRSFCSCLLLLLDASTSATAALAIAALTVSVFLSLLLLLLLLRRRGLRLAASQQRPFVGNSKGGPSEQSQIQICSGALVLLLRFCITASPHAQPARSPQLLQILCSLDLPTPAKVLIKL